VNHSVYTMHLNERMTRAQIRIDSAKGQGVHICSKKSLVIAPENRSKLAVCVGQVMTFKYVVNRQWKPESRDANANDQSS